MIRAGGRQASGSEVVTARSGASPRASEQRSARRRASGNDVQFPGQRLENDPHRTILPGPRILNRPAESNSAGKRKPRQNPSCWPASSKQGFVSSWSNPQWWIPCALVLWANSVWRATTIVAIATVAARHPFASVQSDPHRNRLRRRDLAAFRMMPERQ